MRDYELMVVLDPTIADEELPQVLDRVSTAISTSGGQAEAPLTEAPWGRRRLAYPINDQRDGFYALYRFQIEPAATTELDRSLKLNEQVMRFLVTRPVPSQKAPETEPEPEREPETTEV